MYHYKQGDKVEVFNYPAGLIKGEVMKVREYENSQHLTIYGTTEDNKPIKVTAFNNDPNIKII